MRVLGLTGGIAMGKSTAAAVFRRAHVPVFDADATVHALQAEGGAAVAPIGRAFPGTVRSGGGRAEAVDRALLRRAVLGDPERLRRLEDILHPLVRVQLRRFLQRQRRAGSRLVVLDIPLLLEGRQGYGVDCVVVVTAPRRLQLQRLRQRGGMTPAQIQTILDRQMPDAEKRRRADVLVRTGLSRHHAQRRIRRLIAATRALMKNANPRLR